MEYLYLQKNNLEGSLDLTRLHESMKRMYLSRNRFSGTIDLGNLPESMKVLSVRENALSGTVRMPAQMYRKFEANLGVCCFAGNHDLIVKRV